MSSPQWWNRDGLRWEQFNLVPTYTFRDLSCRIEIIMQFYRVVQGLQVCLYKITVTVKPIGTFFDEIQGGQIVFSRSVLYTTGLTTDVATVPVWSMALPWKGWQVFWEYRRMLSFEVLQRWKITIIWWFMRMTIIGFDIKSHVNWDDLFVQFGTVIYCHRLCISLRRSWHNFQTVGIVHWSGNAVLRASPTVDITNETDFVQPPTSLYS